MLGGDFNACIGLAAGCDPVDLIGACGMGERNEGGNMLMQFVLEHGLQILNRQMRMSQIHESWTCARSLDGALVQIDSLLANTRFARKRGMILACRLVSTIARCIAG